MLTLGEKPLLPFPPQFPEQQRHGDHPKAGCHLLRAMLWEMWLRTPFPPPCKPWVVHETLSVAFAELGDIPRARARPRWEQPQGRCQWGSVCKHPQRLLSTHPSTGLERRIPA